MRRSVARFGLAALWVLGCSWAAPVRPAELPVAAADAASVQAPAAQSAPSPATDAAAARPAVLDLRSAWQAALQHDATLQAARAGAVSSQEAVAVARAQLLPQVQLSAGRQLNDLRTRTAVSSTGPGRVTEQSYYGGNQTLSLRQSLWQPQQQAAVAQASAQAQEGAAAAAQARQLLAQRLVEAFFEFQLAEQQIRLVQVQTAAHARQLDAARKSLEAGSGTRTDIDEAQARLDMDAAESLLAQQQREHARLMLQQLVGQPVQRSTVLDAQRFDATPPQAGDRDEWLQRALQNSPELQALQARRDAAAQDLAKARARHQPTLDLVVQHSRNSPESSSRQDSRTLNRSIGLQFNLPLYAGGGVDAAERQSRAELQRHEALLAAARLDLELRVQQTHRGIAENLLRVKALQQAVRSAELQVQSVERSYRAGVRTTVDVLNAQQQLAEARRNLLQTRLLTLLSDLRLRVLAGAAGEAQIEQLDQYFVNTPVGSTDAALNPPDVGKEGRTS